jgi:hypothetical protein
MIKEWVYNDFHLYSTRLTGADTNCYGFSMLVIVVTEDE